MNKEQEAIKELIFLLAVPSTSFSSTLIDAMFMTIVTYGDFNHVSMIARKVYGDKAAQMIKNTMARPDFEAVQEWHLA